MQKIIINFEKDRFYLDQRSYMQPFDKVTSFEKHVVSPHDIKVGGSHVYHASLQKVLRSLYPQEIIRYVSEVHLQEVDTYVLFYPCSYGIEEAPILIEGIHRAQQLLSHPNFKSDAHILIILYRDLKVAFPERKLQREKAMSEMITEEVLHSKVPKDEQRIHITHEFGTNNLQDTLQLLTGSRLYFEVMA